MTVEVSKGWLKDKQGTRVAPKTLTSQVQTNDGTLLETKIQNDITAATNKLKSNIAGSDGIKVTQQTNGVSIALDNNDTFVLYCGTSSTVI